MGKGLLAWWRQRIVARGLAGAALLAVPVAVAALIGFGTSLSGVAGGLAAVTTGPDAGPVSQGPSASLTSAVVGLAATQRSQASDAGSAPGSSEVPLAPNGTGAVNGTGTGSGSGSGSNGGNDGSPGVISAPDTSGLGLPGGGGGSSGDPAQDIGNGVNGVGNGVNDVLGNVDNGLQGLLGR